MTQNENKINPKTSFKHHRPPITPPWRFAPKRSDPKTNMRFLSLSLGVIGYSKFAPRSAVAAKVSMSDIKNKYIV